LEITGFEGLDLNEREEHHRGKKVKQQDRKGGSLRFKNVCRVKPLVFG